MKILNILPILVSVIIFAGELQAKDFSTPDTVYITYTFSAKEKDSESGYTYFGARYYTDNIMMWLSVDPMSEFAQSVASIKTKKPHPKVRLQMKRI